MNITNGAYYEEGSVFPNSQWAGGPGGRRWSWGLDRRRYRLTSTSARAGARTGKATREGAIVVAVGFEQIYIEYTWGKRLSLVTSLVTAA
jgi:hypothetical protein